MLTELQVMLMVIAARLLGRILLLVLMVRFSGMSSRNWLIILLAIVLVMTVLRVSSLDLIEFIPQPYLGL